MPGENLPAGICRRGGAGTSPEGACRNLVAIEGGWDSAATSTTGATPAGRCGDHQPFTGGRALTGTLFPPSLILLDNS